MSRDKPSHAVNLQLHKKIVDKGLPLCTLSAILKNERLDLDMDRQNKGLEHTLKVACRQVNQEFPDLTLFFIVKAPGTHHSSTEEIEYDFVDHPASALFLEYLKRNPPSETGFIGIAKARLKSLSPIKKKERFLAVFFVNSLDFLTYRGRIFPDTPERYDRMVGYSLAWEAINLYQNYKKKNNNSFENKGDILLPSRTPIEQLRTGLLSESFAAMLMEQQGEQGTPQQLMKKRSEMSLSAIQGYIPENHPFPIAFDSVRLILSDLYDAQATNAAPIKHTLSMVEEIDETYDDITLKQWVQFCYAAQEMAWMGRIQNDILSASTYHSDDAHIRTTAYIIAEALNTDVAPLKNSEMYNPFADPDKYERLHVKRAGETFARLIELATQDHKPEHLLEEAIRQNKALFKSNIIGWCAPALVKTCHAYSKEDIRPELLHDIFEGAFSSVKWKDICRLNRFIMQKKRSGILLTPRLVIDEFIQNDEDLKPFIDGFSTL